MITKNSHPRLGKQKCGASQKSNFATGRSKHQTNFTTAHSRTLGFTLIELLVVISIVGLLSSIVLGNLNEARNKARIAKGKQFSSIIKHSIGDQLVGEWNFNQDNANDSSGFGNDGIINGATPVDGVMGRAVEFDGSNDYVSIADSGSLDITNEITIEVWVNMSKVGVEAYEFVAKSSNYCMYLYVAGSSPRMMMSVNIGGGKYPQGASIIGNYEKWHHIVGVYDGANIMNYVDGELKTEASLSGIMGTGSDSLVINSRHLHEGMVDNVRIYSKALTSAQIQQHYAEGLPDHQNLAQK